VKEHGNAILTENHILFSESQSLDQETNLGPSKNVHEK
jgi:hypothetical protein